MRSALGLVGKDLAHRLSGSRGGGAVVVSALLESERGGGMLCERLEVLDGLAALREQGQAVVLEVVKADGKDVCPLQKWFVGDKNGAKHLDAFAALAAETLS